MESPFFSNYRSSPRPRYSPSTRGIPVHHQAKFSSPKVISIPVHFVGSEKARSAAALKIQKVFRGFLVRKSVRKLLTIRREVDEIDRRISQRETIDQICRDAKERLKVSETLMSLLFRLDSVPGVDSGVRDCRKAIIRKAISLQERVDAIVVGDETIAMVDGGETKVQTLEVDAPADSSSGKCETVAEETDHTLDIKESANYTGSCENTVHQTLEIEVPADSSEEGRIPDNAVDQTPETQNYIANSDRNEPPQETADQIQELRMSDDSRDNSDTLGEALDKPDVAESAGDFCFKGDGEASAPEEISEHQDETPSASEAVVEENLETENLPESSEYSHQNLVEEDEKDTQEKQDNVMQNQKQSDATRRSLECSLSAEERDKSRGDNNNRDLMERMIEDNEKLMGLMTELFERNALQTRLISSLSQRVEQLERAFVCDRLKRKKKRQAAGTVERPDSTPDTRKCGRKSS